jgi:Na+/proline symporter
MMLAPWLLALYAVAFLGALFALAYWGDRAAAAGRVPQFAGWVYVLSLAVHCTSWAYYGTVGQAASVGWALPPTYIGVMALYLLLPAVLYKLIKVSQRERISSVADFVAARFGRDRALAVAVTLIATCGVIPYIALQLKAIDLSFTALALPAPGIEPVGDTSLYVTAVLAAFAMLFGARHVDATEHHPGMMVALAFGSALKLAAFIAVGLFVTFGLFDGFGDLAAQAAAIEGLEAARAAQSSTARYLALAVLGFCAIFCLPWQFHVGVVEARGTGDLRLARLAFPAYLLAISLFVLPIANAGLVLGLGDADLFVLTLPLSAGAGELALLAFIGGLAAATGMVIVACVALATMLCNEVAVPLAMRLYPALRARPDLTGLLLNVRRAAIVLLLAAAWVYHRAVAQQDALASIGELALAAAALLAPAILAGLYWRRASRSGALASLVVGFAAWAWTLLVPTLVQAGLAPAAWLADGPAGLGWLRPTALLGLEGLAPLAHGVLASLAAATIALVAGTLLSERSLLERVQSAAFVDADAGAAARAFDRQRERLTVRELKALTERFVGARRAASHFAALGAGGAEDAQASGEQLEATQRLLAAVVGASSASRLLEAAVAGRQLPIEDVVSLVDGASQALEFSRELLQATLENVSHGISVVDSELRVVAWNRRYLELYRYPPGFVRVGRPVEELLRYNAERGELGPGDAQEAVARRLDHLRKRTPYVFERQRADGTVLDIRGNPMPGGGFVTSYADITGYKRAQRALEEANESLERRVRERTQALSAMNAELSEAKATAERANLGKTRFLAAAGHDLLQPLNAAGLFAGALAQKLDSEAQRALLADLEGCLGSAEALLSDLLDISKLDAGVIRASVRRVPARRAARRARGRVPAAGGGARPLAARAPLGRLGADRPQAPEAGAAELRQQRAALYGAWRRGDRRAARGRAPADRRLGHGCRDSAGTAAARVRGVLPRVAAPRRPRRGGLRSRARHRRAHRARARPRARPAVTAGPGLGVLDRGAARRFGRTGCGDPRRVPAGRRARGRAGAVRGQRPGCAARAGEPPAVLGLRGGALPWPCGPGESRPAGRFPAGRAGRRLPPRRRSHGARRGRPAGARPRRRTAHAGRFGGCERAGSRRGRGARLRVPAQAAQAARAPECPAPARGRGLSAPRAADPRAGLNRRARRWWHGRRSRRPGRSRRCIRPGRRSGRQSSSSLRSRTATPEGSASNMP